MTIPRCRGALAAVVLSTAALAADPWPAERQSTATNIGFGLAGIEPSDLVWHPLAQRLFVVGDEGQVIRMNADGTGITRWNNVGGDLEGITYADPASSFVYVGQESWPMVVEVNRYSGARGRQWPLNEMATGADNSRLEALTFLPDRFCLTIRAQNGLPYNAGRGSAYNAGGLFLAGHQETGRVFIYDINLASSGVVTFVNAIGPFRDGSVTLTDLAGMAFHRPTGMLYCVWDAPARVGLVDIYITGFLVVNVWYLPPESHDEEGIAILDGGCTTAQSRIVIAQDNGATSHDVWVYDGFPILVTTPPGDVNGDGIVDPGDLQLLTQSLIGSSLPPGPTCGWDINQDGALDGEDIATLIGILLP